MTGDLDILAFGAHPDDVEIGMAGTLILHTQKGYKTGICDLTLAELSSNGNVEIRQREAEQAAKVMGLQERLNLELPDRGLRLTESYIQKIAQVIRKYKPAIVFLPHPEDRHPDHGNCSRLVEESVFSAGIRKYRVEEELAAHRVGKVYYYFINGYEHPHFTVDISGVSDKKKESLKAYKSQFIASDEGVETPLNNGYIEAVEARDTLFGKEAGVKCAEGFVSKRPLVIDDLLGD
ncbi:bacillithiol biosynthesis deacetylase BshB1 [Pseudalkalibacillus sp. R45]|uniref:bacillithiol biosynthesis deacetylase BshB1 n=1 Tax=Pseudalkalibacillus sp. R45 TaxID=3457433 RepID=UPI003FCCA5F6